jgi:DnaJ homolog subfamily B member 13
VGSTGCAGIPCSQPQNKAEPWAASFADISCMFQALTTSKKANSGKKQVHPVKLSLEELYNGCLKKVVFQRKKMLADDSVETEDRELVIDIRPGLPDGTRFVFDGSAPHT